MTEINRFGEDENMIPEVPINPGEDIDEAMENATREYEEASRRNAELSKKLDVLVTKLNKEPLNEEEQARYEAVKKEHDETREKIKESGERYRQLNLAKGLSREISG